LSQFVNENNLFITDDGRIYYIDLIDRLGLRDEIIEEVDADVLLERIRKYWNKNTVNPIHCFKMYDYARDLHLT